MQFLILFFKGFFIGYLVIWVVLLLLCLRRRQFWPIIGDSAKTRYFWLATFIFFNPVLTVLYLIFGQIRSPQAKPNRFAFPTVLAIAILGFFVNFPGITHLWMQPFLGRSADANPRFKAHLAAIKSANNTTTSISTSSRGNDRLACRNVAIFCEDDNTLMRRVGNVLSGLIQEIPNIENVNFYNAVSLPPEPKPSPDIFIRLRQNQIKENIRPYVLKLQTEIRATISDTAVPGGGSHRDNLRPSTISFDMNVEIQHRSETIGYESQKYTLAAKDIAKQISEALAKNLEKWRDKHGLLPEFPGDFYGTYKANDLPEPLKSLGAEQMYSYSGFLKHNETIWQLDVTGDAVEIIRQSLEQMKNIGWSEDFFDSDDRVLDVAMKKENRRLYIYERQEDDSYDLIIQTDNREEKDAATRLYIRDMEFMPREEIKLAVDKLFEEPIDFEFVALFEDMYHKEHQDRFFELLREQPPSTLYAQIRLAEIYQSRNMLEESRQSLIRAVTMLRTMRDENNFEGRLKNLAKKLGDEKLIEQKPDRELLLDLGFIEITEATRPFEVEAGPDEPVILFSEDSDGVIHTLRLSCKALGNSDDAPKPFTLSHTHRWVGSTGWGTQSGHRTNNGWEASYNQHEFLDDISLNCRIRASEDQLRFTMSFSITR